MMNLKEDDNINMLCVRWMKIRDIWVCEPITQLHWHGDENGAHLGLSQWR